MELPQELNSFRKRGKGFQPTDEDPFQPTQQPEWFSASSAFSDNSFSANGLNEAFSRRKPYTSNTATINEINFQGFAEIPLTDPQQPRRKNSDPSIPNDKIYHPAINKKGFFRKLFFNKYFLIGIIVVIGFFGVLPLFMSFGLKSGSKSTSSSFFGRFLPTFGRKNQPSEAKTLNSDNSKPKTLIPEPPKLKEQKSKGDKPIKIQDDDMTFSEEFKGEKGKKKNNMKEPKKDKKDKKDKKETKVVDEVPKKAQKEVNNAKKEPQVPPKPQTVPPQSTKPVVANEKLSPQQTQLKNNKIEEFLPWMKAETLKMYSTSPARSSNNFILREKHLPPESKVTTEALSLLEEEFTKLKNKLEAHSKNIAEAKKKFSESHEMQKYPQLSLSISRFMDLEAPTTANKANEEFLSTPFKIINKEFSISQQSAKKSVLLLHFSSFGRFFMSPSQTDDTFSYLMNSVKGNLLDTIVWVNPIADLAPAQGWYTLVLGKPKKPLPSEPKPVPNPLADQWFVNSIDFTPFWGNYLAEEEMEPATKRTVLVWVTALDASKRQKELSNFLFKWMTDDINTPKNKKKDAPVAVKVEKEVILDIDLSFFTTRNPAGKWIEQDMAAEAQNWNSQAETEGKRNKNGEEASKRRTIYNSMMPLITQSSYCGFGGNLMPKYLSAVRKPKFSAELQTEIAQISEDFKKLKVMTSLEHGFLFADSQLEQWPLLFPNIYAHFCGFSNKKGSNSDKPKKQDVDKLNLMFQMLKNYMIFTKTRQVSENSDFPMNSFLDLLLSLRFYPQQNQIDMTEMNLKNFRFFISEFLEMSFFPLSEMSENDEISAVLSRAMKKIVFMIQRPVKIGTMTKKEWTSAEHEAISILGQEIDKVFGKELQVFHEISETIEEDTKQKKAEDERRKKRQERKAEKEKTRKEKMEKKKKERELKAEIKKEPNVVTEKPKTVKNVNVITEKPDIKKEESKNVEKKQPERTSEEDETILKEFEDLRSRRQQGNENKRQKGKGRNKKGKKQRRIQRNSPTDEYEN